MRKLNLLIPLRNKETLFGSIGLKRNFKLFVKHYFYE